MVNTREIAEEYRLTHWAQVMQERTQSGLSIKAYCKQIGICANTYFYWQRRVRAAMGVVAKVLMTLVHLVLSPLYVIEAIAISLVVWLLIDHRLAPNGPSNGDKPARTAWATARDEGIRAISKGIITFAVFIGIGIVFGRNFQELALPGVAITLGSGIASPVQKLVHL